MRRAASGFLYVAPFLAAGFAGPRALRARGPRHAIAAVMGATVLGALALAAWPRDRGVTDARARLAGACLLAPFVLMAVFWVGIGPPGEATLVENRMRYAVLLADGVAVTLAVVLLTDVLADLGERLYTRVALTLGLLAGAGYLVWTSFQLGAYVLRIRDGGGLAPALRPVGDVLDVLLFTVGALTYLATAALAVAFARVGWLGRRAAAAYLTLSVVALGFLVLRGLSFPDPQAGGQPWYLEPGFVAGIPAIPWVIPALLGVVALGRDVGGATSGPPSSVARGSMRRGPPTARAGA